MDGDFAYPPLTTPQDIRLLTLESGNPQDAISCRLLPASLQSPPPYQALSYAWGDRNAPKREIQLNGVQVKIQENLFAGLRYLFSPSARLLLWADAICIDQKDDQEKGSQVQRMHDIYAGADQVVIWLGPEADNSDLALLDLAELHEAPESRSIARAKEVFNDRTGHRL